MPRPILIVHVTPDFEKAFLRLPKHIQALATRKDQWFRKDAFDPRLRTHKLRALVQAFELLPDSTFLHTVDGVVLAGNSSCGVYTYGVASLITLSIYSGRLLPSIG